MTGKTQTELLCVSSLLLPQCQCLPRPILHTHTHTRRHTHTQSTHIHAHTTLNPLTCATLHPHTPPVAQPLQLWPGITGLSVPTSLPPSLPDSWNQRCLEPSPVHPPWSAQTQDRTERSTKVTRWLRQHTWSSPAHVNASKHPPNIHTHRLYSTQQLTQSSVHLVRCWHLS